MTEKQKPLFRRTAVLHQIRLAPNEGIRLQLEKKLQELDREFSGKRPQRTGEALVVRTAEIAPLIELWLLQQEDGRLDRDISLTGLQILSEFSGLNQRRINGIRNTEMKFISLGDADKLLVAMGMEEYLLSGNLIPVPNPNWSYESWMDYMREKGC